MRLLLSFVPILMVANFIGCLQPAEPFPSVPSPDSLVDSCNTQPIVDSGTLVGDFAPMIIGNEWAYRDSVYNWSTRTHPGNPVTISYWTTYRWGSVVLRLLETKCADDHLEHTLHFGFEGGYRKTEVSYSVQTVDSSWTDMHEGTMVCRENGNEIACAGLDSSDALYLGLFSLHQVTASEIKTGADPLTGLGASGAFSMDTTFPATISNPAPKSSGFRPTQPYNYISLAFTLWRGVGVVELRNATSFGEGDCCFGGTVHRASLTGFNGNPATYR